MNASLQEKTEPSDILQSKLQQNLRVGQTQEATNHHTTPTFVYNRKSFSFILLSQGQVKTWKYTISMYLKLQNPKFFRKWEDSLCYS